MRHRPPAGDDACTWTVPASPTPRPRSAAASPTLRAFTVDAGVDVVTFGGTKNGLLGAEAVVFLRPELAAGRVPAQAGEPAGVEDALPRRPVPRRCSTTTCGCELAAHANAMCAELHGATARLAQRGRWRRPQVNSVFPVLPSDVIEPLQAWSFFWDWEPQPPPGPLDDGLGHDARGRAGLRRGRDDVPRRRRLDEN